MKRNQFVVPVLIENRCVATSRRVEKWRNEVARDVVRNLSGRAKGSKAWSEVLDVVLKILRDHGA